MHCNYCYHSDQSKLPFKKGIMSKETGEKIITQAAKLGVKSIKTNHRGESTINPNFNHFTTLARSLARRGTFIDRVTNSNFKFPTSREDIFEGLCNQTKVKVSFDSFIREVFETQRAGGIHSLTMANIDRFYNHEKRRNTEIVIQAVRTKLNKDEDIEGQVKRRWPEATVSIRDMVGGRVEKDLSKFTNRERDFSKRQSCIQSHVRLVFTWNGDALPCCPDIKEKLKIGNIHQNTLLEIFNSIEAKKLRKSLKDLSAFEKDPCKTCPSFETFKGYVHPWRS